MMLLYPIGTTKSCLLADEMLKAHGIPIIDHPSPDVTHLLLDIPSFTDQGLLQSGSDITRVLEMLPPEITVIGGNLDGHIPQEYRQLDLLKLDSYVCANAAITADCAVRLAGSRMWATFSDTPALVLGWGRIGKCLAQILRNLECPVTIAARRASDRALAQSLGYPAVDFSGLSSQIASYPLIFNTVPQLLPELHPSEPCITIDLASRQGILGDTVIWGRGLPGKMAPKSAGKLVADTILHYLKEEQK